ncbi:MAG: hypothetical protein H6810_07220 [Phycisphaeraceae bacterium]|nr:MAG: hypothetical protein H6810_07220 [Phycisphaeraceae bacterium]
MIGRGFVRLLLLTLAAVLALVFIVIFGDLLFSPFILLGLVLFAIFEGVKRPVVRLLQRRFDPYSLKHAEGLLLGLLLVLVGGAVFVGSLIAVDSGTWPFAAVTGALPVIGLMMVSHAIRKLRRRTHGPAGVSGVERMQSHG